jgi:hypothetical protein
MLTDFSQRWNAGKPRFIPKETLFTPRNFEIAEIEEKTAKDYITTMHYSGVYPAARRRFGIFSRDGKLRGCAVFSHPMAEGVLKPFGGPSRESIELGRLVLDDGTDAGFNCESFFIRYCFRQLKREGFRGVISFSDDFRRTDANGKITHSGHIGICYKAAGMTYTGRAAANTIYLLPDGRIMSRRAISKIRNNESGADYAAQKLIAFGADPLPSNPEDRPIWLKHWLEKLTRRARHPGNHRYLVSLQKSIKLPRGLPYPQIKYGDLQPNLLF